MSDTPLMTVVTATGASSSARQYCGSSTGASMSTAQLLVWLIECASLLDTDMAWYQLYPLQGEPFDWHSRTHRKLNNQLLAVLDSIHMFGICHRALHQGNSLVTSDQQIVLLDFAGADLESIADDRIARRRHMATLLSLRGSCHWWLQRFRSTRWHLNSCASEHENIGRFSLENLLYPPDISLSAFLSVVFCLLAPCWSPGHENIKVKVKQILISFVNNMLIWQPSACVCTPGKRLQWASCSCRSEEEDLACDVSARIDFLCASWCWPLIGDPMTCSVVHDYTVVVGNTWCSSCKSLTSQCKL